MIAICENNSALFGKSGNRARLASQKSVSQWDQRAVRVITAMAFSTEWVIDFPRV
jgi:hypothetical protein